MAGGCYTDMAAEIAAGGAMPDGTRLHTSHRGPIEVSELEILTDEAAAALGKPRGRYVTVGVGRIWLESDEVVRQAVRAVAGELRITARAAVGGPITSVLAAGLGNRSITADALGPLAAGEIRATRHIRLLDRALYDRLGLRCDLSAITPGVAGQTGVETMELIRGAAEIVRPSLIVLIDALASRSTGRLATTIQLSDAGLEPGSGIGNHRRPLTSDTLGAPVVVIGAPTVVDSATLVLDALEQAGIETVPSSLDPVLAGGRDFFVSLRDSDAATAALAHVIAGAVNLAFSNPPRG